MSQEQRREMIVHAVLPLVAEHGAAVTTSQLAAAAGIGEATIFRAFRDKEELLDACMVEALRPEHVLDAIAAIPLDDPLPSRLHEAASAMQAHLHLMGRVTGALRTSGHRSGRGREGSDGTQRPPGPDRADSLALIRAALAELFQPEQDTLRLPAEQLAVVLLDVLFSRAHGPGGDTQPLDLHTLIELFLHGALRTASEVPREG